MKAMEATACLWLTFGSAALAAPVPSAPPSAYQVMPSAYQIIQKEGRLAFTDGSSYYDFEKNGTFRSGPLGLSGRTIEGSWKLAFVNDFAGSLVVQGIWGWVNGFSAINDRREMTMSIYPRFAEQYKKNAKIMLGPMFGMVSKIYSCYFVIDELVTLPKQK